MECRSIEKRKWIVAHYNVVPAAHIQLLKGQTKHSDANATIENDYYIFELTDKNDPAKKDIIQCGMGAARDFLKITGQKGLPLFNPLHSEEEKILTKEERDRKGTDGHHLKEPTWNETAKQLYNAIMWTIIIIDAKPNTPIYNIRDRVCAYKTNKPFPSQIKAVNTIIGKRIKGCTLTEAINKFKKDNNIREELCDFNLLIEEISKLKDADGFPARILSNF